METDLKPENAGDFLRKLNSSGAGTLDSAKALADVALKGVIVGNQSPMSVGFLNKIKDEGKGVVLVAFRNATSEPLKLRISKGDTTVAEVEFPIKVSNVDEMFRHIDLRMVPKNRDGSATGAELSDLTTQVNDPVDAYPDKLTNGKYFAFVHGYNVSESKARGWQAEIFKRMHQMGSRARFVGISWYGDTGKNYHKAVFNAFQTGDVLKGAMNFTGGSITIAAHSLGNMVVSHAIADGGFAPDRYYMVNAAVPMEAYSPVGILGNDKRRMTEASWKPYLETPGVGHKVTSARWYELFDDTDKRSELTWEDRFAKVTQRAYNFYSTGDDVVQDPEEDTFDVGLLDIIFPGSDLKAGRGAWGSQEFMKGSRDIATIATMETPQAGWGFNNRYIITGQNAAVLTPPDPAVVATYSDSYLRENPVFMGFLEGDLTDPTLGSAKAGEDLVRYHVLAAGIPALSFAAAVHPIGGAKGNFDMSEDFRTDDNQWPSEGHEGDKSSNQWIHSDFYGVALSHVYKMYEKMIELGALDDENEN